MMDYLVDLYVEIFVKGFGKDKWLRLKSWLCINDNEPLVLYRRTWQERILSIKPWKSWIAMFVWEDGFDEKRVIGEIDKSWKNYKTK